MALLLWHRHIRIRIGSSAILSSAFSCFLPQDLIIPVPTLGASSISLIYQESKCFLEAFLFLVYFCFYLTGQNCVTLPPPASREAGKAKYFISQAVLMERGLRREKGLAVIIMLLGMSVVGRSPSSQDGRNIIKLLS